MPTSCKSVLMSSLKVCYVIQSVSKIMPQFYGSLKSLPALTPQPPCNPLSFHPKYSMIMGLSRFTTDFAV